MAAAADVAVIHCAEPAPDRGAVRARREVHRLMQEDEAGAAVEQSAEDGPAVGIREGLLPAAVAEVNHGAGALEAALVAGPAAGEDGPDAGLEPEPFEEQRAAREVLVGHRLAAGRAGQQHDLGETGARGIDLERHARLVVRGGRGERRGGEDEGGQEPGEAHKGAGQARRSWTTRPWTSVSR